MVNTLPLFINGQKIQSVSGQTFSNYRPMDGKIECEVSCASADDVNTAVAAARSAFPAWADTSGMERGRVLLRAAEIMRRRRDELAHIEVRDTGKPISETPYADVDSAIDALEFFGGLAMDIRGDYHDLGSGAMAYSIREPLGVCAGIGPAVRPPPSPRECELDRNDRVDRQPHRGPPSLRR